MGRRLTRKQHVEEAAKARCNLNIFHAVIAILESGTVSGERAQADAEKIIRLCKSAASRQVIVYDTHVDIAAHGVEP